MRTSLSISKKGATKKRGSTPELSRPFPLRRASDMDMHEQWRRSLRADKPGGRELPSRPPPPPTPRPPPPNPFPPPSPPNLPSPPSQPVEAIFVGHSTTAQAGMVGAFMGVLSVLMLAAVATVLLLRRRRHLKQSLPDHYAALSLPMTASSSEIRSRYLRLARVLHPDRVGLGESKSAGTTDGEVLPSFHEVCMHTHVACS